MFRWVLVKLRFCNCGREFQTAEHFIYQSTYPKGGNVNLAAPDETTVQWLPRPDTTSWSTLFHAQKLLVHVFVVETSHRWNPKCELQRKRRFVRYGSAAINGTKDEERAYLRHGESKIFRSKCAWHSFLIEDPAFQLSKISFFANFCGVKTGSLSDGEKRDGALSQQLSLQIPKKMNLAI